MTSRGSSTTGAWKLHSGRNGDGRFLDAWLSGSIATVGFSKAEPVSTLTKRELLDLFGGRGKPGAGLQIATFRDEIEVDDLIVAPARQLGTCRLGVVTGDYAWSSSPVVEEHHHWRPVRWLGQLNLDELPDYADKSLRHRWTLTHLSQPVADWFTAAASGPLPA